MNWSPWTACMLTCGDSTRERVSSVTIAAANGGTECPPSPEIGTCNLTKCPEDCQFMWESWGMCTATCGDGTQKRTHIETNAAANGVVACPFLPEEQSCNIGPCPVDCVFTWQSWIACSTTCGNGTSRRSPTIGTSSAHEGVVCPSDEEKSCNIIPCPIDCKYTWGEWDKCDQDCGKGRKVRKPVVNTTMQNNGKVCPEKESSLCDGSSCSISKIPEQAILVKLGSKANGTYWPFNSSTLSGITDKSPYKDGEIAAAVLPDGTVVLVPLDPTDGKTDDIIALCRKGEIFTSFVPFIVPPTVCSVHI